MTETIIYTTGYAVLGAVAIVATAALLAAVYGIAFMIATYYAKRLGNIAQNMRDLQAWANNGRPQWKQGKDGVYRLVPTAGPYED